MLIGYARVSTVDQNPELQIKALENAGCHKIFTDKASGSDPERPGLAKAMSYVSAGDTFVCWKIDRVGRNLAHLLKVVEDLDLKDVKFKSLTDPIDTSTPAGKLFLHMLAAFAEFERNLIRERTIAGLKAAALKGRKGGRRKMHLPPQMVHDMQMDRINGMKVEDVAAKAGVSVSTYYRSTRQIV